MKRETKIVVIMITLILLFVSGYGLGAVGGIKVNVEGKVQVPTQATTQQVIVTPATPAATEPAVSTTASPASQAVSDAAEAVSDAADAIVDAAADAVSDAAEAVTDAVAQATIPSTPAEIAEAYNKVLAAYDSYAGNVTVVETNTVSIEVKDLPAIAAAIVNPIVEGFTGTNVWTTTFTNGKDENGRVPGDVVIPGGRPAAVDPAGLASASSAPGADGGYTMTMVFVAESSVFDGTNTTSEPTYHKGAMDPLDLGTLDLGPVTIAQANMSYPGATLEATVDGEGRLVKLHNNLPLEGTGTGKAGIEITLKIGGSMDVIYEMTYA